MLRLAMCGNRPLPTEQRHPKSHGPCLPRNLLVARPVSKKEYLDILNELLGNAQSREGKEQAKQHIDALNSLTESAINSKAYEELGEDPIQRAEPGLDTFRVLALGYSNLAKLAEGNNFDAESGIKHKVIERRDQIKALLVATRTAELDAFQTVCVRVRNQNRREWLKATIYGVRKFKRPAPKSK